MRIGLVEFLLILAIASLTIGPQVALFVDRWMRRANRANARARAEYAAQMAVERDALLKRFRTASTVFGVCILLALVYALVFRPIDTPPQGYTAPDVRQDTGAARTELSADSKDGWKLGDYLGVDYVRTQDGLVYAAAYDGASMKKRKSDLVRTDGGHDAAILSVEGELTGFAFDGNGDLWLTVVTPTGGTLCRARHDSWGTSVEPVVTQLDGAPLGALSAVEAGPDGKVYFAAAAETGVKNGLEGALRTGAGLVYLASVEPVIQLVLTRTPECCALPCRTDADGGILAADAAAVRQRFTEKPAVLLAGPGLGPSAARTLNALLTADAKWKAAVLDADALNALAAGELGQFPLLPTDTVLTPHPGEAARLLGGSVAQIQTDRPAAAQELAERYGCVAVLKGSGTLIAAPGREMLHNPTGNPGLARGGSGDVLAGMLAALLAQGLAPFDAAACAVWVHGAAADRCAARTSQLTMLPHDILTDLADVVKELTGR